MQLCDALAYDGYTDWFLPSKDELNLMYANLHKAGLGGFSDAGYWSSSEYYAYDAWWQRFYNGYQIYIRKSSGYYKRAARAF